MVQNVGRKHDRKSGGARGGRGEGALPAPQRDPEANCPVVGTPITGRVFDLLPPPRNEGFRRRSLIRLRAAGACGEEARPWGAAPPYAGLSPEPVTLVR
ncbi:MAG TPA: hypothetical protein VNA27_09535 [Rubrobacteraceae bacterium]|nr:hypothetical protein [Rubrobacteraceae bacterium]